MKKKGITCFQCRFPFYVCTEIKKQVMCCEIDNGNSTTNTTILSKKQDALNVVDECNRKFKLFMSHSARCTNQNKAIQKIHDDMINECYTRSKSVTALMIGDFKMKFEPLSSRETSIDHCGKRGISWHGFCIQFYLLQNMMLEDGSTIEKEQK